MKIKYRRRNLTRPFLENQLTSKDDVLEDQNGLNRITTEGTFHERLSMVKGGP